MVTERKIPGLQHVETVYKRLATGELKGRKPRGRWLIRLEDLDDYVNSKKKGRK